MTLLILAAGLGSRYGGLKQLDPMTENGEFIIDFSVFDAIRAGFDKIVFLIKKENLELFKETIGNRIEKKVQVSYVFQDVSNIPSDCTLPEGRKKPWGTGHAVYCARNAIHEPFAVINADDYYGKEAFECLAEHLKQLEKAPNSALYCMVGYQLGNTLTESGTVSRGVCNVLDDGTLKDVTERTKIEKRASCAAFFTEDGNWQELPFDTVVSMNCWGFSPMIFERLEQEFTEFFHQNSNNLKSEFYLPFAVQDQINAGLCKVLVYPTVAKWEGVTYIQDKERVKSTLAGFIEKGDYPKGLWK